MYLLPKQEQEIQQKIINNELPLEITQYWKEYNQLKNDKLSGGDPQMRLEYYLKTGKVFVPNIQQLSRDESPEIDLNKNPLV